MQRHPRLIRTSAGLKTSIRTVRWPGGLKDSGRKDFETQARRLRYRQLGAECHDRELRCLLLAHHADDQAETILGRIVSGYTGPGLRGTKATANIPECEDMWGVSEGPGVVEFSRGIVRGNGEAGWAQMLHMGRRFEPCEDKVYMASSGIIIHRPLLDYHKVELRKICEETGTRWMEDSTNADVGLTMRNSIRSLLHSNRLPLALRPFSLLELGKTISQRRHQTEASGGALFNKLQILNLDPRFGCLRLRLTADSFVESSNKDTEAELAAVDGNTNSGSPNLGPVAKLITRIANLVSPYQQTPHEISESIALKILEEVHAAEDAKPLKFTGAGACWHKLQVKQPRINGQTWEVSRQVPGRSQPPSPRIWASENEVGQIEGAKLFGLWQLLDNRFWVQLSNIRPHAIVARIAKHAGEVESLRDRWTGDQKAHRIFNKQIKVGADEGVRRTLPVLARHDTNEIIALPSLGILDPKHSGTVSWKILYKAVDLGTHADAILRNGRLLTA